MDQQSLLKQASDANDFALARSDFLDRFADVEALICRILEQDGSALPTKEPFGNRLKAFSKVAKPNLVAKCRTGQRNAIVDSLGKILPIRADIVHSRMHITTLERTPVALFINSQIASDPDAPARIMTLDRIKQLAAKLDSHAKAIDQLRKPVNPASSPPPPSQGAAGDP